MSTREKAIAAMTGGFPEGREDAERTLDAFERGGFVLVEVGSDAEAYELLRDRVDEALNPPEDERDDLHSVGLVREALADVLDRPAKEVRR